MKTVDFRYFRIFIPESNILVKDTFPIRFVKQFICTVRENQFIQDNCQNFIVILCMN